MLAEKLCEDHRMAVMHPELFIDAVCTHVHSGSTLNLEET